MISSMLLKVQRIQRALLISLLSLTILSCGSESLVTAGISGTGIVFGVITGFGSIYVNGVKYDIDDADFDVDGQAYTGVEGQQNLEIGMVVRLEVTDNGDGTGVATRVDYDDAVEGPISAIDAVDANIKHLQIFNLQVIVDAQSTQFKDTTFNQLAVDDVVEVSGFLNQDGDVVATLIEFKEFLQVGRTEVELRGTISDLDEGLMQFLLNDTVTIRYDTDTELEDITGGLSDGLYVEVKGRYQNDSSVLAEEIEAEDEDRSGLEDASGEVSLQGIITSFTSVNEFSVSGIAVELDGTQVDASILAQLTLGLEVEVKGEIQGGILLADEIEIED